MTTLNNINWQLTAPVHNGQNAQREIVQHKRHARKRIVLLPAILLAFSLAIPVAASEILLPRDNLPACDCEPELRVPRSIWR